MGNCWRMPEDHSSLLDASAPSFNHLTSPSDSFATTSYSTFSSSTEMNPENNNRLKRTIWDRTMTDSTMIKNAQGRNLLERLPLVDYNEKSIKQTECDICLNDFLPNEKVRQLPCDGAHVFHPSCVDDWVEKNLTCPHCLANIDAILLCQFVSHANSNDNDSDDD